MFKLVLAFIVLTLSIHFTITMFRKLTGAERWQLAKTTAYSVVLAVLSLMLMTLIVVIF